MSQAKEAVVILTKCGHSHKTHGIRFEQTGKDQWLGTWAFPIKEASAKREGYEKASIKGAIRFSEAYPGCPDCGTKGFILCSCGRLSCNLVEDGVFTCPWCGGKGKVGAYTGQAIAAGKDY